MNKEKKKVMFNSYRADHSIKEEAEVIEYVQDNIFFGQN